MNSTQSTVKIAQHTPGPWKATYGNDMSISIVAPGNAVYDELSICRVSAKDNSKEREQNARLIASAPELLEALEDILLGAEAYAKTVTNPEYRAMWDGQLAKARSAIARAEGRG